MDSTRFYISTIAPDAPNMALSCGMGLEIAEYCTAYNMDMYFAETHAAVSEKLSGISHRALHAPFNELFPCAIDPRARELAKERYLQAIALAADYGADRIVIHGGFYERMYYPIWYTEQSAVFWKEFMSAYKGDIKICLENVFEPEPELLIDIVNAVGDPRLGICLDVGHVNAYSKVPPEKWIETCADKIMHFHIHNNHADFDSHSPIFNGSIDMEAVFNVAERLCPAATFTLELLEAESSVKWLAEKHVI